MKITTHIASGRQLLVKSHEGGMIVARAVVDIDGNKLITGKAETYRDSECTDPTPVRMTARLAMQLLRRGKM